MAAINLPRLSSAAPIVQQNDTAAQQFVGQWNALCNAIETNVNALAAQQAQIDAVLGIANGATTDAALAQALANYLSHLTQQPIASGQIVANATGSAAVPTGTALSVLMDLVFGGAQGDVLYRGTTVWAALPPGTSGDVLTTGGSGVNPAWAAGGGSGLVGDYHDFTSSRSAGVIYTNTQLAPIILDVIFLTTGGAGTGYIYVGGILVWASFQQSGTLAVTGEAFINPGQSYEVNFDGGQSILSWFERY